MYLRVYHLLLLADYVVGAVFSVLLLAVGAFALSVGGWLKPHELKLVGGAYTLILSEVESQARELRSTYCADAYPAAAAHADCGGGESSIARSDEIVPVTPS